jgi:SAM-dependent methyltransferase
MSSGGISRSITGCSTSPIEFSCRNASSSTSTTSTTSTNSSSAVGIAFDRNLKRLQRDGASRAVQKWRKRLVETCDAHSTAASIADYDYFRREIASRLVDRLEDIRREEGFPLALDLGCGSGNYLYRSICSDEAITPYGGGIGGIRKLVQMDSSPLSLHRDDDENVHAAIPGAERCQTYQLVADEEAKPLPFPDATFDLVLSSNSLHFVNGNVSTHIHIIVSTVFLKHTQRSIQLTPKCLTCLAPCCSISLFIFYIHRPTQSYERSTKNSKTRWLLYVCYGRWIYPT